MPITLLDVKSRTSNLSPWLAMFPKTQINSKKAKIRLRLLPTFSNNRLNFKNRLTRAIFPVTCRRPSAT
ncbi:hypothetical protein L596_005291 [Steinernema carpocapsae]|uniref:Uncharacterized protein n=1 Tax=Steinernema carpocapsae TaxID=34508 RepID=A0A4U8UYM6_STECR|nr:hypothetical protein L596_005291 [Steinernema carpocapsae]